MDVHQAIADVVEITKDNNNSKKILKQKMNELICQYIRGQGGDKKNLTQNLTILFTQYMNGIFEDEKQLKQKPMQKLINLKEYDIKEQDEEKNNIKSIKDKHGYYKNIPDDIIELKLQIIKQFIEFPINTMLKENQETQNCAKILKTAEDFGVKDIYVDSNKHNKHCLSLNITDMLEALNNKKLPYNDVIMSLLTLLSVMEYKILKIKSKISSNIIEEHIYPNQDLSVYANFYKNYYKIKYNEYPETQDNLEKHLQQCKYVKENTINLIEMLTSYNSNINSVKAKIDECQEKIDNYDKLIKEIDDSLDSNFE